jgi:molybdate transport system substrate-binding protein
VKRLIVGLAVLALAVVSAVGCGAASSPGASGSAPAPLVRVAAASDVKFALDEIIADFARQQPAIKVEAVYGSSGNFATQITNGAPFDMFFSADLSYPQKLQQAGLTRPGSLFEYAVGRLVLSAPKQAGLEVASRGVQALTDPKIRKIAIANPQHAPYGQAAVAALKSLKVYDQVRSKLVFGENIAQAAEFVTSGAADVGLIALSLVRSPKMAASADFWEVPLEAYPTLRQGGVILNPATDVKAAEHLRAFVTGPQGRAVLERYGFFLPRT